MPYPIPVLTVLPTHSLIGFGEGRYIPFVSFFRKPREVLPGNSRERNYRLNYMAAIGGVMADDERSCLNIALIFLELILDLCNSGWTRN